MLRETYCEDFEHHDEERCAGCYEYDLYGGELRLECADEHREEFREERQADSGELLGGEQASLPVSYRRRASVRRGAECVISWRPSPRRVTPRRLHTGAPQLWRMGRAPASAAGGGSSPEMWRRSGE